jgi:hypothetical protein
VDREGELASDSKALFGKELCDLIVNLEAVSSGYGKEIVCVLAGTTSYDITRNVDKSHKRSQIRRRSVIRKVSA